MNRPSTILAQRVNRLEACLEETDVTITTHIPRRSNRSHFSRAFEWKAYRCKSHGERQAIPSHCRAGRRPAGHNLQAMIRLHITGGVWPESGLTSRQVLGGRLFPPSLAISWV